MARKDKKTEQDQSSQKDAGPEAAASMPLFYKKPEPLDAKKHASLALKKNFGFGFTKEVNAVPVNLIEMPQVCHYYPIAFSPDGNATPVAILGLRDNENLFLNPKSEEWDHEAYIPAYIRRYPFIFSELPDKEQLTLCVDVDDDVIEQGGDKRFFDDEGQPTQLSKDALDFCKSYHAAAHQTLAFSQMLEESGLLIDREAQIKLSENRRINFSGFKIISEKKLAEVDDKTFLEWREKGFLPMIYAHLFSAVQWHKLSRLLNERLEAEAA